MMVLQKYKKIFTLPIFFITIIFPSPTKIAYLHINFTFSPKFHPQNAKIWNI